MPTTKRAYSEEAKQERERKIITAAESLLLDKGYFAINMEQVAQAAGLAKGTVYLYFTTKEELFLRVYERQAALWLDGMQAALSQADSSPETLVDVLVKSLVDNPMLTRLVALTSTIFEYNLPLERAREHKVWIFSSLAALGQLMDAKFNLRSGQAVRFLLRAFIIVAGLEGFAHPSPITLQVYEQESTLTKIDFEGELRSLLLVILNASRD